MTLSLRWGTVTAVRDRVEGLVRLEVDGVACLAYPQLTGEVEERDVVLVNTQAQDLGLGSGGFDILYANLTRGLNLPAPEEAHVMVLPYTPLQNAVRCVEESDVLADDLGGMPVVCCGVHSQLGPALAGIGPGVRVAYVQVAGGALPVSLSDTVRVLKNRNLLDVAIAVAPCHDADAQGVTVPAALAWARGCGFDIAVCGIGPGIVGTGSPLGHGGIAVSDAANAAAALGGRAIIAPRISEADARERHRGVSHHTQAALRLCLGRPDVAWPQGLDGMARLDRAVDVDVTGWEEACSGLPLTHMGRGAREEPWFFAAAFAAGRLARAYLD